VEDFLFEDLRIDEKELKKLKKHDIGLLADKYNGNYLLFKKYFEENYG